MNSYLRAWIGQYYCRARQDSALIYRFASRDLVLGEFKEPLTLHKYLYCLNEPVNRIYPWGLLYTPVGGPGYDRETTQEIINMAIELVGTHFIEGPVEAFGLFGRGGEFDYKYSPFTFQLAKHVRVVGSEFSNWLAGYTCFYNYGLAGARAGGQYWAGRETGRPDDPGSKYFIAGGILTARERRIQEGKRAGSNMDLVFAKFDLYEGIKRAADTDLTGREFDQELYNFLTFWNSCSE